LQKAKVIADNQRATGGLDPEVQVALLTARIHRLNDHFGERQGSPLAAGFAADGVAAAQASRLPSRATPIVIDR
jgi:hypothetical protein